MHVDMFDTPDILNKRETIMLTYMVAPRPSPNNTFKTGDQLSDSNV